jgi:AcrR family transcriptional regulator
MAASNTGTTRKRRTGVEAKNAILDVAERRLVSRGISGLKLQELAKDLGVSHPAILHHYGSRGRMVDAVIDRVISSVLASIEEAVAKQRNAASMAETLFKTVSERENARKIAWLALGDGELKEVSADLSPIVGAVASHLSAATGSSAKQSRAAAANLLASAVGLGVMSSNLFGGARDAKAQETRLRNSALDSVRANLK